MRENEFYAMLVRRWKGTDLLRIENAISSGIPDVNGYDPTTNTTAWLELKVDRGTGTLLRPAQHAWINRASIIGRRVFIVTLKEPFILQVFRRPYAHQHISYGGKPYIKIVSPPAWEHEATMISDLDFHGLHQVIFGSSQEKIVI